MKLNVNELRKLAGLSVVVESSREDDDEDGLSKAERELASKAEKDLEKKGIKVKDFDPDEAVGSKKDTEEKPAAKKEEKPAAAKPAPKKDKPAPAKKEEKPAAKDDKPAEKKARAPRPENPSKKASQIRAHLNANPDMTRGQFTAYAIEKMGMSKAGANTYFYKYKAKKEVKEGYILVHPSAPGFVLAENKMMNQYQWVDGTSTLEPEVFVTEAAAKKVAQYMTDFKFQTPVVESFLLGDGE